MRSLILAVFLIQPLFFTWAQPDSQLERLESIWSLSPVKKSLRHKSEGLALKKDMTTGSNYLEVSTWYEDPSISEAALPDSRLFCRFMHSFAFGRAKARSEANSLPATEAFKALSQIDKIRFVFFADIYSNQPSSPYWDKRPSAAGTETDPNSKLRVVWTREEKLVPYLSLEVSRDEWRNVLATLQLNPKTSYGNFSDQLCANLYKLMPNLRSNFGDIQSELLLKP